MARWGIGRGGITGSKVEGGRGGWETGQRSDVYGSGGGPGGIVVIGGRRKRRGVLGTGALSAPPRVEIPLTRSAFCWKMTGIETMVVMNR